MWAPLIEKAFAKIHGCYENLGRGSIEQGLRCLTGAPLLRTPLEGLLSSAGGHGGRAVDETVGVTVADEMADGRRQEELWSKMKRYNRSPSVEKERKSMNNCLEATALKKVGL